ncbi:MAG: phosphoserine phosphatase SerB, partial [Rhodobacteraceae bacterium]|nr:phosphoserine phosphatase SerB [Paracoccaceae bacterium]
MFTATLITAPSHPALEPEMLMTLRNAWGGKDARMLAPGEAGEFTLPTRPDNFET